MHVRYKGPLARVELALPGALIGFDRNETVDLSVACKEAGIDPAHAAIAIRGLKGSPDWEIETAKASKSTKADDTSEKE